MSRQRRRTLLVGLVLGSLVGVGLAACSSERGSSVRTEVDRSNAVPVLAGETSPAGTRVRDGFTVPEGAALVGPVLPVALGQTYGGVRPEEWVGLMVVDGVPGVVFDRLVAQAVATGFSDMPAASRGCVGPSADDVAGGMIGPGAVMCSARGVSGDGSRAVEITLRKGRFCGAWVAQVSLLLSDFGDSVELPVNRTPSASIAETAAATRNPHTPGDLELAGPGATIDVELTYAVDRASPEGGTMETLRIERGSQPLLGFISEICPFTVNPRRVLMRVQHGQAALRNYERQAAAMQVWDEAGVVEPQITTRGRWTVSAVGFDNIDTSITLELYEPGDGEGPSFLRIVIGNGA